MTDLPPHGQLGHNCMRDGDCFEHIAHDCAVPFTRSVFAPYTHPNCNPPHSGIYGGFYDDETKGWGILQIDHPDQAAGIVAAITALAHDRWGVAFTAAVDQRQAHARNVLAAAELVDPKDGEQP